MTSNPRNATTDLDAGGPPGRPALLSLLAGKNPAAASRAVRAIRDGMRTVEAHPGAGRPVEHLPPEFREWPIPFGASGYLVRYRVEDDRVVVLAVKHQREAGYA